MRQVASKYREAEQHAMERFASFLGQGQNQMSSRDCAALMDRHLQEHIPVAFALFSAMLAEPAFTAWTNETEVAWASFLRRMRDTWTSSLIEKCNRALNYDSVRDSLLRALHERIRQEHARGRLGVSGAEQQRNFEAFFTETLAEAGVESRARTVDVPGKAAAQYDIKTAGKFTLSEFMASASEPDPGTAATGWFGGLRRAAASATRAVLAHFFSRVDTQAIIEEIELKIEDILQHATHYDDGIVIRIVDVVDGAISANGLQREEKTIHRAICQQLCSVLVRRHRRWEDEHGIYAGVMRRKQDMRDFFNNIVRGLNLADIFAHEM